MATETQIVSVTAYGSDLPNLIGAEIEANNGAYVRGYISSVTCSENGNSYWVKFSRITGGEWKLNISYGMQASTKLTVFAKGEFVSETELDKREQLIQVLTKEFKNRKRTGTWDMVSCRRAAETMVEILEATNGN